MLPRPDTLVGLAGRADRGHLRNHGVHRYPRGGGSGGGGAHRSRQQIAAVLFDRYGLLRLPQNPVNGVRLGGVAPLLMGVALIQLF